jgi:hypothetical protein
MVPIEIDMIAKVKITAPKSKRELGKGGGKIFNDTHPQYPPPQKRWRPKAVEINQTATKTENETATPQLSAGTTDSPAIKAGPSADDMDCPILEFGPSALRQDTSNDVTTLMEK